MNKTIKPLIYEGVYNRNKGDWYYGIVTKIFDNEIEVVTLDNKRFGVKIEDIIISGKLYDIATQNDVTLTNKK